MRVLPDTLEAEAGGSFDLGSSRWARAIWGDYPNLSQNNIVQHRTRNNSQLVLKASLCF